MRHVHVYKLAAIHKVTLMYFLVNIHINNQSTRYKVNGVPYNTFIRLQRLYHTKIQVGNITMVLQEHNPRLNTYALNSQKNSCSNQENNHMQLAMQLYIHNCSSIHV